jgi:CRISPR-associated protein Csb3
VLIGVDDRNPAQFFASCGFFELASFLDPGASARWVAGGLELAAHEQVFRAVVDLVARLELRPDRDWDWTGDEKVQPFDVVDAQSGFRLRLDWWEKRTGGNALWKTFAAQMKALDTTQKLKDLAALDAQAVTPDSLLSASRSSTGRLGLDPRSAWDADGTGFAPNQHDTLRDAATYAWCELLASIGLQTYPFRARNGRLGEYYTWNAPLPITLARAAATGGLVGVPGQRFEYRRVMRGKGLSGLGHARPVD